MKRIICALLLVAVLPGCTSLVVSSLVEPAMENLQQQDDLELVCEGAPAFLLMVDSMLVGHPENARLLAIATQAYSSYVTSLAACGREERATALSIKAKDYGLSLLSPYGLLHTEGSSPESWRQSLERLGERDIQALFWGGYGWAVWLEAQNGSPAALAQLLKVEQIMLRVVELDETYYYGTAHLFLGAYYGSRPAMFGGKPEDSLQHFEKALDINKRQFLPVQVAYAETYCRTIFDRDLYESLLKEVIDFPLEKRPDLSLANQLAKIRAAKLLGQIDLYF
ncbi:MAG: TRAP transporter TatT component family protein [Desulfobulbaceae bacterium]|nr:TRAP transporter TatT component family protein [Desulfobulbaceae bacterium]